MDFIHKGGAFRGAIALFAFAAAPILSRQCMGTAPASSSGTVIAKNSGSFTAPGMNKEAYATYPFDLSAFPTGGTLVIEAMLGKGESRAPFDLFPNMASVTTTGRPA